MMKPKEGQWEKIVVDGKERTYHTKCWEDDKHRYILELKREINLPTKKILVILLNPSDADSEKPDPTSENLVRLLKNYNWISILNLYPCRSSKPEHISLNNEDANKENDKKLKEYIDEFDEIFCGWGEINQKFL